MAGLWLTLGIRGVELESKAKGARAMQAITTKVLPPTVTKGTRIKAKTASGLSVTKPWDYELDELDNARRTVIQLIIEKGNDGWHGTWLAAATADGYVFVRDDNPPTTI